MHVLHIGARVIPHFLGCVSSLSLIRASVQRARGNLLLVRVYASMLLSVASRPVAVIENAMHRPSCAQAASAFSDISKVDVSVSWSCYQSVSQTRQGNSCVLTYVATCSRKSCSKVMRLCSLHGIVVLWAHITCRLSYGCHVSDPTRRVVISVGMSRFVIVMHVLHIGARVMSHTIYWVAFNLFR